LTQSLNTEAEDLCRSGIKILSILLAAVAVKPGGDRLPVSGLHWVLWSGRERIERGILIGMLFLACLFAAIAIALRPL
jgi:hypothetical protein